MNVHQSYLNLVTKFGPEELVECEHVQGLRECYDVCYILYIEDYLIKNGIMKISEIYSELVSDKGGIEDRFKLFFALKRKFIYSKDMVYKFAIHSWNMITNRRIVDIYIKDYLSDDLKKMGISDFIERPSVLSSEVQGYLSSNIFTELLNRGNLIRFENGVYDVELMKFRDGLPSDFVDLTTGLKLPEQVSPEEEQELDDFLSKVFPDEELKHYFLCFMGSCLEGRNKNKIFCIWSGSGSNGKSALAALIEQGLGAYVCKSPTSLFTGKRSNSSSATPELMTLEDRLISFVQESDSKEVVNVGTLKELTGNDTIYVRGLYSESKNIVVKCKFILVTNKVYNLSGADSAAWARIKVIPFESTFLKEDEMVRMTKENKLLINTYKLDPRFIDRMKILAGPFIKKVINYYENSRNGVEGYDCENLPYCEKVEKMTEDLRFQNSPVSSFCSKRLEKYNSHQVSLETVFSEFRLWGRQYYSIYSYTINNFTNELLKLGIEVFDDNIIGYKLTKSTQHM